jgi:hypothetical protein
MMFMIRGSLVHVYALFGYLELMGALICSLLFALEGKDNAFPGLRTNFLGMATPERG